MERYPAGPITILALMYHIEEYSFLICFGGGGGLEQLLMLASYYLHKLFKPVVEKCGWYISSNILFLAL